MASHVSATGQRVLKNSLLRVGGYAVGGALQFAIITLIARYLGTAEFGHFAFIAAFVSVFQLVADMGVRNILIREIAVDLDHFQRPLGIARTLLWCLSLLSLGLIVLLANLLQFSEVVRQATYLAGLAVMVMFHSLGYSAVLRAFEEVEWDLLGLLLHKVIFIGLLVGLSATALGLRGAFAAMLLANTCQWLYSWSVVGIRHGRARLSRDFRATWGMLAEAFPLGVAEVLRRLTQHVDKILLTALSTPVAVGLFSVAYKFLEAMQPFASSVTLPLFPIFSRMAQESSHRLLEAYAQSLKFLYAASLPMPVVLFVFAEQIVVACFGAAYREATWPLRLLTVAMVLLLPTSVYSYVFTALGQQRLYTGCVVVSLLINVLLDLMLVPSYSYIGAAIGTCAAEAALFLSGMLMLWRLGGSLAGLQALWRPLLASLGMGGVCWLARDLGVVAMALGTCGGLVVYTGLLLVTRTFTRSELTLLRHAIQLRRKLGSPVR